MKRVLAINGIALCASLAAVAVAWAIGLDGFMQGLVAGIAGTHAQLAATRRLAHG